jgi:hypothetical protein
VLSDQQVRGGKHDILCAHPAEVGAAPRQHGSLETPAMVAMEKGFIPYPPYEKDGGEPRNAHGHSG